VSFVSQLRTGAQLYAAVWMEMLLWFRLIAAIHTPRSLFCQGAANLVEEPIPSCRMCLNGDTLL